MKFLTKRTKITDVAIGQLVRSCDISTGIDCYRTVTNTMKPIVRAEDQVRLISSSGATLITSKTHPTAIYKDNKIEYVPAGEISSGDLLIAEEGLPVYVDVVDQPNVSEEYADFSVDEHNNYYAGMTPDQLLLAHNSCTITFPIWHYQYEDLITLKNNQGTEETRVRQMDYSVVINSMFWRRLKNDQNITLFDPHEVPDLYEAFYRDSVEFERLYIKYEKTASIKKKTFPASEIIKNGLLKERTDTGRIYILNIDNVINQGPFVTELHPIYQSNLCQEILLPTKPFQRIEDPTGRIALCTLGSINWGEFKNPQDMRKTCRLLVRSLSNLLGYQDFLSIQSKLSNEEFEPLGVGVTNLAYWHAKRNLKYGDDDALAEVKRWMEHQAFYLTEATVDIAKERGPCKLYKDTYYGRGVFPWERRNKNVDELTDFAPSDNLDWEDLRQRMITYGVRNATLMAIAPVESSSVVLNSTNGIEMPMELITVKESKAGSFTQVVPEYRRLKNRYQLLWEQTDCIGYLKTAAVLAAYVDQSISTNTFYSPKHFADGKVPATLIAKNLMLAHRWGIKSIYYSLLNKSDSKHILEDFVGSTFVNSPNESDEDSDCDACKL